MATVDGNAYFQHWGIAWDLSDGIQACMFCVHMLCGMYVWTNTPELPPLGIGVLESVHILIDSAATVCEYGCYYFGICHIFGSQLSMSCLRKYRVAIGNATIRLWLGAGAELDLLLGYGL